MSVKEYGNERICRGSNARIQTNRLFLVQLLAAAILLLPSGAVAAEYIWDISPAAGIQPGDGSWGTDAYWTTDGTTLTTLPGAGNSARFSGADGYYIISLAGNQVTDSIAFDNDGYTLTGGTISFTTQAVIGVNNLKTATIASVLTSSSGFTKNGTGTCILSVDNTFTGSTMISSGGTLQLGDGGTSGSIDASSSIYNEGTLIFKRIDTITIYGMISGAGTLVQDGAGKTILTGYNSFSGSTQITTGTLQIGDGGTNSSLNGTNALQNDGTLIFNNSDNQMLSCAISGNGELIKDGFGGLSLLGTNTYTGPTIIRNGALVIDGSISSSSAVTVEDSAIISGGGVIVGQVTVLQGGGIAPGSTSPGKMTTGTLLLTAFSGLEFRLGPQSDTIAVNGNLTLAGLLNINATGGFTAGTYTLFTVSGTITDNGVTVGVMPPGYTCTVTVYPNSVTATLSAIGVREWIGGGGNNVWSTPGNWSGSIVPVSTDSVVFQSASTPCSLDVAVTVRSIAFESGFTQNFYMNQKKVTVTNALSFNMPGALVAGAGDTICFDGPTLHTFVPRFQTLHPILHQKGTGSTEVSGNDLNAIGMLVTGGSFHFRNYGADTIQTSLSVQSGVIDFKSTTLTLLGDVDLSGADAVVNSGGTMNFAATGTQNFTPGIDKPHPAVVNSSSGTLYIRGNRLKTRKLQVLNGSVVMDTALTADSVDISSSYNLQLDTAAGNVDTIHYLSGSGNINFGQTELFTDKSLQLSTFTGLSGNGSFAFFNEDSISFNPGYNGYIPKRITKWGNGKVLATGFALKTPQLFLHDGIWQCSTMGDSISDTLWVYGRLDIGTSVLKVNHLVSGGGEIHFNTGALRFTGNGGSIDFGGSPLYADSGKIEIAGGISSVFEVYPQTADLPMIEMLSGADTVRLMASANIRGIRQYNGYVDWGNNFTHMVDTLDVIGGTMNFGNSYVWLNKGDVQLNGLTACIENGATLRFNGPAGTQTLTPPAGVTLPAMVKSGAATVQVATNALQCRSIHVYEGIWNFNGFATTVDEDLKFGNGTVPQLAGIDGITVTVGGNVFFWGQSGNMIQFTPAVTMYFNVSGTLTAGYTVFANCDASGTAGQAQADVTCIDNGGNINWYFQPADVNPPTGCDIAILATNGYTNDADPLLQLMATQADSMRIALAPDTLTSIWKLYASQDSIDISSGGEGVVNVYVQYKDISGNRADWVSASTIYDITVPAGGILTITDNSGITNDTTPPLQFSATGADSMRIALAVDTFSAVWRVYASQDSIDISSGGDGGKDIYVQFKDMAGNRSVWVFNSTLFDATAPVGCSVAINDTGNLTTDATPRLQLYATGADSMRTALSADTAASAWNVYVSQDSIDISSGGDGLKMVYAQFKDLAGNRSGWVSDTTMYDTTAPAGGSVVIDDTNNLTNDATPRLQLSATGADSMRIALAADTFSSVWRVYTSQDSIDISSGGDGGKDIYVQYKDRAGNRSAWIFDNTTFDMSAPLMGSVAINDTTSFTTDATPPLQLSATGADSMRIGLPADTAASVWKMYALQDSIDISSGGDGLKIVYVQYKDLAGNRSGWVSDTTTYDVTAPSGGSVIITDNSGATSDATPPLQLSVTGGDSMRIALSADTSSALWKGYALHDSINISGTGIGMKVVFVQYKDLAGNRSGWMSDSTVYDTTIPTGSVAIVDKNGYSSAPGAALSITASSADSMRSALVADTSTAVWKAIATTENIAVSTSTTGMVKVGIQLKNMNSKLSVWYVDSTWFDATSPVSSIVTAGGYNDFSWRDTVKGSASDTGAGVDSVKVTIQQCADGNFWTGTVWQKSAYSHLFRTAGDWSVVLPASNLQDGDYDVSVQAIDKAGNSEVTKKTAAFSWFKNPVCRFSAQPLTGTLPLDVVFIDSSINSVAARLWSFGDGTNDTARVVSHRYDSSGAYTVSLIVHGPGGSDTLAMDTVVKVLPLPPVAALSVTTTSGSAPLQVSFSDNSTGKITDRTWLFGDGSSDTSRNPVHTYIAAGSYTARLMVAGAGGSDTVESSAITVIDTTSPNSVEAIKAIALNCSTVVLSWKKSVDTDVDSTVLTFDDTGYATHAAISQRRYALSSAQQSDTISGFYAGGVKQYITAYFIDASGNYSVQGTTSACEITLNDCVVPEYSLNVKVQSIADSAITVTVNIDELKEKPVTLSLGIGSSREDAQSNATLVAAVDTTVTKDQIRQPGWWFVASSVADSSGNTTLFYYDSIAIINRAPEITFSDSFTVDEDTLWRIILRAHDYNGDSLTYTIDNAPNGVALSRDTITWVPDDHDVGMHKIQFSVKDARGAAAVDSAVVTVLNREEVPVAAMQGDTILDEDIPWQTIISVVDQDVADTHLSKGVYLPSWVSLKGDTLSGIPTQQNIGSDSIVVAVIDKSGLSDTLYHHLEVRNVNDSPSVVKYEIADSMYEKDTAFITMTIADPDRGDTLLVSLTPAYSWIVSAGKTIDMTSATTTLRYRLVPVQADTGKKSVTVTFSDRAGAACRVAKTVRILDADDAPIPPRIVRQVAFGAVAYRVTSRDDRDSVLTYTATLQSMSDTSFVLQKTGISGRFSFYPLDDGKYRFMVYATDHLKNSTPRVYDTVTISGASRFVTADTLWEMISVPQKSPASMLGKTKFLLHWDESIEEKQVYHYYQQKAEIDSLQVGSAYWRKGTGRDTITLKNRMVKNSPVAIHLSSSDQGWNQISSPYPYPVVWRGDNKTLWKWNGQKRDFEESDTILEPWQGYWIQSDSSATVLVDTIPYFRQFTLAKKKTRWFSDEKNWMFGITLTSGGGMDAENRFGIHPLAKKDFDSYDRLEPPRIAEGGSLFFPHADWNKKQARYSADVRGRWEDINLFEFCLAGERDGENAHVRIDGFEQGMPLYIYITGGDSLVPVLPDDSLKVTLAKELQYKTLIIVNDPSKIRMLPLKFGMGNPYPNPFCPSTRLQYVLPYRWEKSGKLIDTDYHVTIDIYDLMGRKVRNLVYRTMKPGMYQLFWDGKSENGRVIASGHYFIRLKADSFESTKKLIMVR